MIQLSVWFHKND